MDILVIVVIAAAASGYVVELAGSVIERFTIWNASFITQLLSPFVAAGVAALLGKTGWVLIPIGLASGFLYLVITKLLARPVQIQQVVSSRRL